MPSFCTVVSSTKRNSDQGGGKRGPAATHLSSLLITPLWPVSGETVRTFALNSPREMKECFHVPAAGLPLPDVKEGDRLVVAGVEYPIDHVAEWTDNRVPCLHIVVGEIKRG
jgi:hypothetical protein